MATLESRVDRLEEAMADLAHETARMFSAIYEELSELRAHHVWVDQQILDIHREANQDRRLAEKDRLRADQDRQQAEKDRQQAEKDRQQAEKDRQQAEKDRQQAEKDRKDFNRRLAEATDAQGLMIENMVWPNLPRIAAEIFGEEPVETRAIRIKRRHPVNRGTMIEIDLMAVGPKTLLICEAKSKVDPAKVADFLAKLRDLPGYFPEFAHHRLVPMIASIAFDPSVLEHMTRKGVYALGFGDETMELLNKPEIR